MPRGGEDGGAQRLLQSHCQGLLVKVLDYFSVFFCLYKCAFKESCSGVDASLVELQLPINFLQPIIIFFILANDYLNL